jgi:3-deoxy-D-manno-octulosonic-acid transferase
MQIYRLLGLLILPLVVAHFGWKAFRFKQLRYLTQRLGFGYHGLPRGALWLHCASVGEVNTAMPLLRELQARKPALRFVITTNTPTGAAIVARQKLAGQLDKLAHCYLPFDWPFALNRFIDATDPRALVLLETELWPNLVAVCKQRGVGVIIINGRLSPKTTATRGWFRGWVHRVLATTLAGVDDIYARSAHDRNAFIELGANAAHTRVVGNLKYAPPQTKADRQNQTSRVYVVAASTHADEEQQIAERWLRLGRDELLVIAPRHPERRDAILKQLSGLTPSIALRSRNDAITDATAIYLLDSIGELNAWFADARLVIIGGSFAPIGGHNLLEPAHQGHAVIFGPHMENFRDEAELVLQAGAALQVASLDELQNTLESLLDDEAAIAALERNTRAVSERYAHVLADYANIVIENMNR